jgi:hypothetical protein
MEREIIQNNHTDNELMLSEIVTQQDLSFFNSLSLPESLGFVSNLSRVNKQCNKACNCPIFTRKLIRCVFDKHVGAKCGIYEASFVTRLRTDGARQYKELSEKLLELQSYNSNMKDIKTWIENGADVRYRKLKNVWGTAGFVECPVLFPLSNAVAQNLTDVVALLFAHEATVNGFGATLLNMAIEHDNSEMVIILLNNGVVIDKPRDGISSVARAVRCGNNTILKIFFDRGIDFNSLVTDCFKEKYSLSIAADKQQWESVIFLLGCGAVKGAREAFDHAKYLRGNFCEKKFLCRSFTREKAIEEVKKFDAVMKALLLTKEFMLTEQDVQEALQEKDKDLLRVYCECDEKIKSQILAIYPDVLKFCYQ